MQCRNCSGNEFRKTESGNYKCLYCGTLYYEEKQSKVKGPVLKKIYFTKIIAAGAIVLLTVLIISIINNMSKIEEKELYRSPQTDVYPENGATFSAGDIPEPQGIVLSVDMIPDSIGNHYFLALCKNTGKVAVRAPHVIIRLYSGDSKVGSGSGYAFMNDLNPGEITPVLVLIQKPPKYSRFETEYTAERPFVIPENGTFEKRFTGEISDVVLKMAGAGSSYKLKGRIKNIGEYSAKYVHVAAVIYNSADKAIGYGSGYISEKVLKPGEFDLFDMYITTVAGKPHHYKLYYYGMVN